MIIGVSGKIGSGKDTVGKIIQYLTSDEYQLKELSDSEIVDALKDKEFEEYLQRKQIGVGDWKIMKFAKKLKRFISDLTGIPIDDLELPSVKDRFIPELGMTVRQLMTSIGGSKDNGLRKEVHMDIWVYGLFTDYLKLGNTLIRKPIPHEYPNWVITDLRFPNELEAIKSRKGFTIRLQKVTDTNEGHESETALDLARFDHIISNDGSLEELVQKVKKVLIQEKIIPRTND